MHPSYCTHATQTINECPTNTLIVEIANVHVILVGRKPY